jgi:hypothetical protein
VSTLSGEDPAQGAPDSQKRGAFARGSFAALGLRPVTTSRSQVGFSILLTLLVACAGVAPVEVASDKRITGPTIIGLLPKATQAEIDDHETGVGEGMAHISFALEDTVKCLAASGINAEAEMDDHSWARMAMGGRTYPHPPVEAIGALLLLPGKEPVFVSGEDGPSFLMLRLPKAAGEFFPAVACTKASEEFERP